ncbi:hypothetical protein KCU92_g243, partial [Aureobasidium melanogenum]
MYRISIGRSKNRKGCISGVVGVAMLKMGELTFLALRGAMIAAPRGWMKIGVKTVRSAVKSVRSVVKCVGWQMVLRSKEEACEKCEERTVLGLDSCPPLFKHSLVFHGVPSLRIDDFAEQFLDLGVDFSRSATD